MGFHAHLADDVEPLAHLDRIDQPHGVALNAVFLQRPQSPPTGSGRSGDPLGQLGLADIALALHDAEDLAVERIESIPLIKIAHITAIPGESSSHECRKASVLKSIMHS